MIDLKSWNPWQESFSTYWFQPFVGGAIRSEHFTRMFKKEFKVAPSKMLLLNRH